MTIELTKNDCESIHILAGFARQFLETKREIIEEHDSGNTARIELLRRQEEIARDFEVKFERIALTAGIVERVALELPVHN